MPSGSRSDDDDRAPVASPRPRPDGDSGGAGGPGDRRASPERGVSTIVLAVGVALVLTGVLLAVLLNVGGARRLLPGRPDPREAFGFPKPKVQAVVYRGRASARAVRGDARRIHAMLNRFYDAAFMDPRTWREGPSREVWRIFSPAAAKRARRDVRSLTIGRREDLRELEVRRASLRVRILVDPRRRPQAAIASALFVARGALADGTRVAVRNEGHFLLRPSGGRWRVVGYPEARTRFERLRAARKAGAGSGGGGG